MATVPDLSGIPLMANGVNGRNVDRKLTDANRNSSGSPSGAFTPHYTGERVLDTVGYQLWAATDLTNTGWHPITRVVGGYHSENCTRAHEAFDPAAIRTRRVQ